MEDKTNQASGEGLRNLFLNQLKHWFFTDEAYFILQRH